jgi:hypothetical protein
MNYDQASLNSIITIGHLTGIGGEATLGEIATSSGRDASRADPNGIHDWARLSTGVSSPIGRDHPSGPLVRIAVSGGVGAAQLGVPPEGLAAAAQRRRQGRG